MSSAHEVLLTKTNTRLLRPGRQEPFSFNYLQWRLLSCASIELPGTLGTSLLQVKW